MTDQAAIDAYDEWINAGPPFGVPSRSAFLAGWDACAADGKPRDMWRTDGPVYALMKWLERHSTVTRVPEITEWAVAALKALTIERDEARAKLTQALIELDGYRKPNLPKMLSHLSAGSIVALLGDRAPAVKAAIERHEEMTAAAARRNASHVAREAVFAAVAGVELTDVDLAAIRQAFAPPKLTEEVVRDEF